MIFKYCLCSTDQAFHIQMNALDLGKDENVMDNVYGLVSFLLMSLLWLCFPSFHEHFMNTTQEIHV